MVGQDDGDKKPQPPAPVAPGPVPVSYRMPVNYYDAQQAHLMLQILAAGSEESTASVQWLKGRGSSSLSELNTETWKRHVQPDRVLEIVNIREFDDISVDISYTDGSTVWGRLLDNSIPALLWVKGGGEAERSVLRCIQSASAYRADRRHALRIASIAFESLLAVGALACAVLILVGLLPFFSEVRVPSVSINPLSLLVYLFIGVALGSFPPIKKVIRAYVGWTGLARLTSPHVASGKVPVAVLGVAGTYLAIVVSIAIAVVTN